MAMESISQSRAIFAMNHNTLQRRRKYPLFPTIRRFPNGHHRSRFSIIKNYQQYDFQDFQGYAKPSRLLGATQPKVCLQTFEGKDFTSLGVGRSQSLFKVKLQTSNAYGSSLSDQNAGILLCLIDKDGDSILQRIPVILNSNSAEPMDLVDSSTFHFQRGSIDEFIFEGPQLERIEALWVSIESGQWRLGGVSLTVISACKHSLVKNDSEKFQFTVLQYEFEVDEILLGEESDIAVVELRSSIVSELSGADPLNLLSKSPPESTTSAGRISNEDSMREYADLKLSLLSYDAALIFVGSILANFLSGENEAFAFFVGGIGGFLYLLLLQQSVDRISTSPPISEKNGSTGQLFRVFKGPITGLSLAVGLTSLALKYSSGDLPVVLTSKELVVGIMGFLACKVAVVLAAFRPMSIGLKETEL